MEGLVPARSEHGLSQPVKTEHEQQRADDNSQDVDGHEAGERDPHGDDQRGKHNDSRSSPFDRRPPSPGHTGSCHNRQGLDHLDGARPEHRKREHHGRARHGRLTSTRDGAPQACSSP